jgi:hypothetical protein
MKIPAGDHHLAEPAGQIREPLRHHVDHFAGPLKATVDHEKPGQTLAAEGKKFPGAGETS